MFCFFLNSGRTSERIHDSQRWQHCRAVAFHSEHKVLAAPRSGPSWARMDSTQILINLEAKNLLAFRKKLLFQFCLQSCCPRSDWIGLFPWAKKELYIPFMMQSLYSLRDGRQGPSWCRGLYQHNMFYMSCEKDDAKAGRCFDFCCPSVSEATCRSTKRTMKKKVCYAWNVQIIL